MADRPRVLVIDDDPLFRNLLVRMLRQDCLVSVASEGSEGFHKALEHPPDVAIIDIEMPGWNGLETLKAFRAEKTLQHVPIMIFTSDASRKTVVSAIEAGADSYIIKTGMSREEFYRKLEKLRPGLLKSLSRQLFHEARAYPARAEMAAGVNAGTAAAQLDPPTDQPDDTASRVQEVLDNWE